MLCAGIEDIKSIAVIFCHKGLPNGGTGHRASVQPGPFARHSVAPPKDNKRRTRLWGSNPYRLPERTTEEQQPFVQAQKKQAQTLAESVDNSGFGTVDASI